MSRQDANATFARTSFLYGGNAAYIEDLQAKYENDPAAVDAESKIAAMESAGIRVSPSPARIGKTLVEVLKS
jgi:2-oxoglutarate dehydrogenase complex dehydrogenase (E1) component-like enzyme